MNDADVGTVAAAMSINVAAVNDIPVAPQVSSVTINEDTAQTFAASDFLFTDVENDSLASITISGLTLANGDTLTVEQGAGPVAVTNGMTITACKLQQSSICRRRMRTAHHSAHCRSQSMILMSVRPRRYWI